MITTFLAVLDLAQRQAVRLVFGARPEDFAVEPRRAGRRPTLPTPSFPPLPDGQPHTSDTFDLAVEALVFASDVPLRADDVTRVYDDVTGAEVTADDVEASRRAAQRAYRAGRARRSASSD